MAVLPLPYLWIEAVTKGLLQPPSWSAYSLTSSWLEVHRFFLGWWHAEGGNGGPSGTIWHSAKWNWLNTMQLEPGSTPYNAIGIQNYLTWDDGVRATLTTLHQAGPSPKPDYRDIVAAVRSGAPLSHWPAAGLATWVSGEPWSTNGLAYAAHVKQIVQSLPLGA
jgi:hypothetical protein